jgi:hypothetical protein
LIQNLPAVPDHFSTSSTAISALKNLSHSIPFIHPFEREEYLKLGNYRVHVEYSTSVIEALIRFINTASSSSLDVHGCIPLEGDGFVIKNKHSQRSRKNTRTRPQITFDSNLTKACEFLNISFPDTPFEARSDFQALMQGLRAPFMVCYLHLHLLTPDSQKKILVFENSIISLCFKIRLWNSLYARVLFKDPLNLKNLILGKKPKEVFSRTNHKKMLKTSHPHTQWSNR